MKKALLVSYVFPPMAAVGGQRVLYFCRHLRKFGWEPVVLTIKGGANVSYDPTLLDKIPDTKIYRSVTFEPLLKRDLAQPSQATVGPVRSKSGGPAPKRSFLDGLKRWVRLALSVPDHAIFWVPFGVLKGLTAIRKEKPEVIFSSSPPVSAHIVASILSRLTGRPHVVDFRDLWTLNHLYPQRNYPRIVKAYDRFWERFVLRRAAAVITASPGFTRQMSEFVGCRYSYPIETVTNGFDYEEASTVAAAPETKRLRFLYVGSLYADFNPTFFFEGLRRWLEQGTVARTDVQVDFYGNSGYDYTQWLRDHKLDQIVTFHGFRPRSELVPKLLQTDCLLLFLGFSDEARNVIPAKLFEYIASGATILAIAPQGVTTELIEQHQAGICVSEENQAKLIEALQRISERRRETSGPTRQFKYVKEIDRVHLTEKLAALFDRLTDARSRKSQRS